jgi:hypothetical protein
MANHQKKNSKYWYRRVKKEFPDVFNVEDQLCDIEPETSHVWEIMYMLLKNTSGVLQQTLFAGVNNNYNPAVKLLLKNPGVNIGDNNNYAIQTAVKNKYHGIIDLLLADSNCDPGDIDNNCIRNAVRNQDIVTVAKLLKHNKVDPSSNDNVCLKMACKSGNVTMVKLLLSDNRVDPTVDDGRLFKDAGVCGQTDLFRLLFEDHRVKAFIFDESKIKDKTPEVNSEHKIRASGLSLEDEIRMENIRWCKELLCSALAIFPKLCFLVLMILMVITVIPTNPESLTERFFYKACAEGNLDQVKLFRVNVDPSSNNDYCLKISASNGYSKIVSLLLDDNRVNPNTMNSYPLKWAIIGNHTETVKILVRDHRVKIIHLGISDAFPEMQNIIVTEIVARKYLEFEKKVIAFLKSEIYSPFDEDQIVIKFSLHN